MEERPDLLLGIIVTHIAKQQQQQQQQQQQVAGKAKTSIYNERPERAAVTESAVNVRTTPTVTSTPSTVIREIDTIASPANQVKMCIWLCVNYWLKYSPSDFTLQQLAIVDIIHTTDKGNFQNR